MHVVETMLFQVIHTDLLHNCNCFALQDINTKCEYKTIRSLLCIATTFTHPKLIIVMDYRSQIIASSNVSGAAYRARSSGA